MVYFAHDKYIGRSLDLYGEYSEGEIALFDRLVKPGMTVVEVDANIGCHTIFLAKKTGAEGRVIAIEAQGMLYRVLRTNLDLNGLDRVTALHCACGARQGTLDFPAIDYTDPANFGGMSLADAGTGETVPVLPLDALDLHRCDFIKIDVEGMETEVIAGAVRLLEECRPVLYVENDRFENQRMLTERIAAHGYSLYSHCPPLFNKDNFLGNDTNVFGPIQSLNMLCIPENSSLDLSALGIRAL
jgi:FkbM family methyltransferase